MKKIIYSLLLIVMPMIMLTGCGDSSTKVNISINTVDNIIYISQSYAIDIDNYDVDVTYEATAGGDNISIKNNTFTVLSTAIENDIVVLKAVGKNISSNQVTLTINHIEATSINLDLADDIATLTGSTINLSSTVIPSNATRDIEYYLVGTDIQYGTITNNVLYLNESVTTNQVRVQAKIGDVTSAISYIEIIDDSLLSNWVLKYNGVSVEESFTEDTADRTTATLSISTVSYSIDMTDVIIEIDNTDVVTVTDSNKKINLVGHGTTDVTVTIQDVSSITFTITVLKAGQVILSEEYDSDIEYSYSESYTFDNVLPNYEESDLGSDAYTIEIFESNSLLALFTLDEETLATDYSLTQEIKETNIVYSAGSLSSLPAGNYEIVISSLSGSKEETSVSFDLIINTGTDVYNENQLIDAYVGLNVKGMSDSTTTYINLQDDIELTSYTEFLTYYSMVFNGNGFTIDYANLDIRENYSNLDQISMFVFEKNDPDKNYDVDVKNVKIVGPFSDTSAAGLAEVIFGNSSYAETVKNMTVYDLERISYYLIFDIYNEWDIQIEEDDLVDTITYTLMYDGYYIINLDNITINDSIYGISIDTAAASDYTEKANVTNIYFENMLQKGLVIRNSNLYLDNIKATNTTIPVHILSDDEYFTTSIECETAVEMGNTVDIYNYNSDDSFMLEKLIANDDSVVESILNNMGGISSILKIFLVTYTSNLVSLVNTNASGEYNTSAEKSEAIANIQAYSSNILVDGNFNIAFVTEGGNDMLELESYSRVNLDVFYDGVNTTDKYLLFDVSEIVAPLLTAFPDGGDSGFSTEDLETLLATKTPTLVITNINYTGV